MIDYCLNDVRLTKMLLDLVIKDEVVRDPRDSGKFFVVKGPEIKARGQIK